MAVAAHTFQLTFADQTALLTCNIPALSPLLTRAFGHCLDSAPSPGAASTPPELTYRMAPADEANYYRLDRHQTLLYRGRSIDTLLIYLMQDLTTQLTTHCQQHLVFHAAGLAYNRAGILVCGQSGHGKSTLTALLLRAGFDYLTDELLAINLPLTRLTGLSRAIVLKAGSRFVWHKSVAPEQQPDLLQLQNNQTWVDPDLLRHSSIAFNAIPQLILFPAYQPHQPFLAQPLTPATTAFHLLRHLLNAKNLPNHGVTHSKQLARQAPGYSLTYSDVAPVADWLKRTLSTPNRGFDTAPAKTANVEALSQI